MNAADVMWIGTALVAVALFVYVLSNRDKHFW
jgi:hypothetical protein